MTHKYENVWWKIETDDAEPPAQYVQSVSVTESIGEMTSCTISMLDPTCEWAHLLRPGKEFRLSWGDLTKKRGEERFRVNSPSGGADESGQITLCVRGLAIGDDIPQRKYYSEGTKGSIVTQKLQEMGITQSEVDFAQMSDAVNNSQKVYQNESDFRFLARLADEWRCAFRIGTTKAGTKCAVFCENAKLPTKNFSKLVADSSALLEYGEGSANVISYEWHDDSFNSAVGSAVRISYQNGEPVLYRYNAEQEKVSCYRLNEAAVKAEMDAQSTYSDKVQFTKAILSARDFEEVKRFFVEDTITTAPQGTGVTLSAHVFGDVYLTATQQITLGKGIPGRIGEVSSVWYAKSVTHNMSTAGYFCDVEVVNALVFSPTGEKV